MNSNNNNGTMLDPSLLNLSFQWNGKSESSASSSASSTSSSSSSTSVSSVSTGDGGPSSGISGPGYIQLPHQQIYRSAVPDLETLLQNMKINQELKAASEKDIDKVEVKDEVKKEVKDEVKNEAKNEAKEEATEKDDDAKASNTNDDDGDDDKNNNSNSKPKQVSASFIAKGKCVTPPSATSPVTASPVFATAGTKIGVATVDTGVTDINNKNKETDMEHMKLPLLTADAIFRRLDQRMANIKIH